MLSLILYKCFRKNDKAIFQLTNAFSRLISLTFLYWYGISTDQSAFIGIQLLYVFDRIQPEPVPSRVPIYPIPLINLPKMSDLFFDKSRFIPK